MFSGEQRVSGDLSMYVGVHGGQGTMIASTAGSTGASFQQMAGRVGLGVMRFGRRLARRALCAHQRRVALRELEALDDRMLKDIGLARGSIPYQLEGALTAIDEAGTAIVRSTQRTSSKGVGRVDEEDACGCAASSAWTRNGRRISQGACP